MKRSYVPFIVWMVFMTVMLLMPSKRVPSTIANFGDHLIHAAIMFVATWLWYFPNLNRELRPAHHIVLLVGFAVYSMLTEIIQEMLIPGRSGDVSDFMYDMVGVVLAMSTVFLHRKLYRNVY